MRTACLLLLSCYAYVSGATILHCPRPHFETKDMDAYGRFEKVLADGSSTIPVDLFKTDQQTLFAVKRYPRDHEDSHEHTNEIYGEFCIGRSLAHPNIASTVDLVRSHDAWNLVIEFCDHTLADVLRASPDGLPVHAADRILLQLLDAMSYMHGQGIAHHDLKPSNIMFDAADNVKIIDFGTAYRFVDSIQGIAIKRHGPYGSIPFNAPEVYGESLYTAQSVDIFALGVLYCAMLQPRLPWKMHWAPSEWHHDTFGLFETDDFYLAQDPDTKAWIDPLLSRTDVDAERMRSSFTRLAGLLPAHARALVSRMLEPDPEARATWGEIFTSSFISEVHLRELLISHHSKQ